MSWTIDDAVSSNILRDAKIFLREISFRLGSLRPKIRVRLFRYPGDREIYFDQSHFIEIPDSAAKISPPLKSDNTESYALTHAVEAFTHPYEAAVEQGLEPSDSWLVVNHDY